MRPSKHLAKLHDKMSRRLNKLRRLVNYASTVPFPDANRIMSYVTLECHSMFANFARSYFLSCTISTRRETGPEITCIPTIVTFNDAISACMRRCKHKVWLSGNWTRRDEPPWHQPKTLIDSCHEINCSNYTDIIAAFSVPTRVFNDLTKFRNYFAHRNEYTFGFTKVVANHYSIPTHHHPSKILCTQAYGRPQVLMLDWIDDIEVIIEFLCR